MGSSISILVPCHPPKAHFLHGLLSSFALNSSVKDVKFYILLTSEKDYPVFSKIVSEFSGLIDVNFIFIREYLEHTMKSPKLVDFLDSGCNKGVAVFKKFVGMHWATRNLKGGVVCIDAEVYCLKFTDFHVNAIKDSYSSGRYIGFNIDGVENQAFRKINEASELLMHSDLVLSNIYTWFFDIPYYGIDDLNLFFEDAEHKFGSCEEFLCSLSWHTFEHIVFLCWRVRKGNGTLQSYNHLQLGAIPEQLGQRGVLAVQNGFGYTCAWMHARFFYKENALPPHSVAFLYHTDRI